MLSSRTLKSKYWLEASQRVAVEGEGAKEREREAEAQRLERASVGVPQRKLRSAQTTPGIVVSRLCCLDIDIAAMLAVMI